MSWPSHHSVETGLQILSQINTDTLPPECKELLEDLFVCESAHIRYQEEYASFLVQGRDGRDTSRLLRWMDELGFYVPSTVFQSFRDDGKVNMKGSVQ